MVGKAALINARHPGNNRDNRESSEELDCGEPRWNAFLFVDIENPSELIRANHAIKTLREQISEGNKDVRG